MKKILSICLCLVLILLTVSEALAADKLPSIDSVLKKGTKKKVEVKASLGAYTIDNAALSKLKNPVKLLILERRGPKKKFTSLTKEAPVSEDDGFPEGYTGKNAGKARIWVRGDLMAKVPARFRAKSLKDATYILMAETAYVHSSTLMHFDYEKNYFNYPPEFETTEEMIAYFAAHQPVMKSITFHPMFDAYSLITIYEVKTKKRAIQDYKQVRIKQFAKNPDAAKHWDNMGRVMNLIRMLESAEGMKASTLKKAISGLDFVPNKQKSVWTACVDGQEYSTALSSVTGYYWTMAEKLKSLDQDEKHQTDYNLIISNRDAVALSYYVKYCNYSGLKETIENIRDSKEYMAKPDTKWLEKALKKQLNIMLGK